jgi:hypothetical protein
MKEFGLVLFAKRQTIGKNIKLSRKMLKMHQKLRSLMDHGG